MKKKKLEKMLIESQINNESLSKEIECQEFKIMDYIHSELKDVILIAELKNIILNIKKISNTAFLDGFIPNVIYLKESDNLSNKGEFKMSPADQIKTIEVANCKMCPFVQKNNGFYGCNIAGHEIFNLNFEELPKNKAHDKCPLKNNNYRIRLK